MLNRNEVKSLKNVGFVVVPYLDSANDNEEALDFAKEIAEFNEKNYTDSNLATGTAYPSDSSETRTSNAYLVSEKKDQGVIPHIQVGIVDEVNIMCLVRDWDTLLAQLANKPSTLTTVSLVNMQEYRGHSKAVPAHQDGMYFKMHDLDEGAFGVTEALIAEYVGVLVLTNEGTSGTVLREVDTGLVFSPTVKEGELIIFDNIRFTHEVPMLTQKRSMVGIRNWSYNPYHYTQDRGDSKMTNSVGQFFTGHIQKVTSDEAEDLFIRDGKPYEAAPF